MRPKPSADSQDPLWKRLEHKLLQDIRGGRFDSAGRLPSEHELAERFGVNRHTARQAIAGLVQRGIIFKRKGGGSYLVPAVIDYEIGERTRFSTNVALQGREPSRTLLEVSERKAHDRACSALAMADGEMSIFIRVIGEADGIPISIGDTYLPARRFQGFGELYRETMSITKTLARYDVHDYTREMTRVIARNPSEEEVRHLRQSVVTPILAVESVDIDRDRRPIVYHETRFAGERVQFVVKHGEADLSGFEKQG
ncbi:phosphonate metabolism transcriptional regulator PhnF [Bradyrhizobium sp. HKCCYLS1011]|uniref:phosphonate metabolism transcriptional regulator PhnF n=1 Tax=Bradyrhizobium sp. HKCCYLS1011 TaxID=3420733 RepID=UPI003EBDCE3A